MTRIDPDAPVDPNSNVAAYVVDGTRVEPTPHAAGPWFADQQHGAAVMGLLARFLEAVPAPVPMRMVRITADLSRAVPMAPLEVTAQARRDGRRVQSLEAQVSAGGQVVARAVGTRIRVHDGLVPASLVPPVFADDRAPALPAAGDRHDIGDGGSFHDCLDMRIDPDPRDGLRLASWYRVVHPLVAGEVPSPLVRAAAVADMVMSSAMRLGDEWISINPEVTLQLERDPDDGWMCVDSVVRFSDDGIGISEAVLYDEQRRFGRSAKATLNDRLEQPRRSSTPSGETTR